MFFLPLSKGLLDLTQPIPNRACLHVEESADGPHGRVSILYRPSRDVAQEKSRPMPRFDVVERIADEVTLDHDGLEHRLLAPRASARLRRVAGVVIIAVVVGQLLQRHGSAGTVGLPHLLVEGADRQPLDGDAEAHLGEVAPVALQV